jgi:hypothetical protein
MFSRNYALCCINSGLVMWLKISWKHMSARNYATSAGVGDVAQNMLETYVCQKLGCIKTGLVICCC